MSDPEGGVTRFGYDALGREVSRRLANGVSTETRYDAAGRVTVLKNRGERGARDEQLRSLAYLYNAAGQRSYQVDERGRITAYDYDEVGRLKAVRYPFESDKKLEDFQERLTLGLGPEFRAGKKEEVSFALPALQGGEAGRLREDLQEELLSFSRKPGQAMKGRWEVGIGEGATEFAGRLEVSWEVGQELEDAYGLISESRRGLEVQQRVWTEEFGYDERSNRAFKANGWGRIEYAYNPANEILAAGMRSYAHDRNGNLIREALGKVEVQYRYTPENRLERISGEAEVGYAYDALGRRSIRQNTKWRGGRRGLNATIFMMD